MTTKDILQEEFDLISVDLKAQYIALGMRASGKWADALEVLASTSSATILGLDYTEQLVNGRPSGKQPPVADILNWIIEKGIKPLNDRMRYSTLAFLIARKIGREGTKYFQQGGTDLVSSVITPERIQNILDRVADFNISMFTGKISDILNNIAK